MFSYEYFLKKINKCSDDKIEHGVFGGWYGNTLYVVLIFLVVRYIVFHLLRNVSFKIGMSVLLILWVILILYLVNRRCGMGIGRNRFVYIIFKPFTSNEKRVYDIPYEKIKYLDVKKFLGINFVKMSFISDIGKIKRIYFFFSGFNIRKDSIEIKKSSKEIISKLSEIQKVLDKGDF